MSFGRRTAGDGSGGQYRDSLPSFHVRVVTEDL